MQRDDFFDLKEKENEIIFKEESGSPIDAVQTSKPHERFRGKNLTQKI